MRFKIELLLAALLFLWFVMQTPFGISSPFSFADEGGAATYQSYSKGPMQSSGPDTSTKSDEMIYPLGDESGSNTLYGHYAGEDITSGENNSLFGASAGAYIESGDNNSHFGQLAGGLNNSSGSSNSYFGQLILRRNDTTVNDNSFFGRKSGYNNNGSENTFFGSNAGYNNKSASFNSFFGMSAGYENTAGAYNSFFGWNSGYNNLEANYNSFFGYAAGWENSTGSRNSFFGHSAGINNTNGEENAFFGESAGFENISGDANSFFGKSAGHYNTTGNYNTFVGHAAGGDVTLPLTGGSNVFVGQRTGWWNTSGHSNTFLGRNAGAFNTTGYRNTFVGRAAGFENHYGNLNVFLGSYAGYNEMGSNKLYIDNSSTSTPLIWGDFSANNVVIHGGFRSIASYMTSDERLKKNIQPLKSALDKISSLQGISYEWRIEEYPDVGMKEGRQIGLIAQDVEKVFPELVTADKDGYKSVSYLKMGAVLLEAVKELKAENERLCAEDESQQNDIEELRVKISDLNS